MIFCSIILRFFLSFWILFLNFYAQIPVADTIAKIDSFQDYQKAWEKIKKIDQPLETSEYAFLLVTNRNFFPDSAILLSDDLPKNSTLHLVWCQYKNNNYYLTFFENFETAFSQFSTNQNISIFIHGDGKTFVRSLENGKKLTQFYNVNWIVFDYPSRKLGKNPVNNYFLSRKNAIHSLPQFQDLVLALDRYRQEKLKNVKISVMAHSLGGYFMANYLTKYQGVIKNFSWENLILMLPAVSKKRHERWLNLSIAQQNYVFFNPQDWVLKMGSWLSFTSFLGLDFGVKTAKNTSYIDISKVATIYHTPFDKKYLLNRRPQLYHIFSQVFQSEQPELTKYQDESLAPLFYLRP